MNKGARSSAVVALLVIVAGLAIAACGSSSSSSSGSGSSAGSTSTSATGTSTTGGRGGFAALTTTQRSCLKSHGLTLPTGGFRGHPGTGTFTRPAGAPPAGGTSTTGGPGGGYGGGYGGGAPAGGGRGFFGGGGANASKFLTAAKACGVTFGGRFGAGAGGGFGGRGGAAVSSTALKKFVSCVNAHGYKLTGVNTSGTGEALPKSLQTNKKFLAAAKDCTQDLRPGGGAPTGTATTSGT
jgi:hypothetical protein